MASRSQIEKFESLHAQMGSIPSKTQTRAFKNLSNAAAFEEVGRLIEHAKVHGLFNFTPAPGMATPKRVQHYARTRNHFGTPASGEEVEWAKAQTDATLNQEIVRLMRDHQAKLDALGVTPSETRLANGWYDAVALRQGKREAAERRQQREEEAAVRRRVRAIGRPQMVEKFRAYDQA